MIHYYFTTYKTQNICEGLKLTKNLLGPPHAIHCKACSNFLFSIVKYLMLKQSVSPISIITCTRVKNNSEMSYGHESQGKTKVKYLVYKNNAKVKVSGLAQS